MDTELPMPLNNRLVVDLIMRQEQGIEERYEGYREDLFALVVDVIEMERLHAVQHTNIMQKIGDKCSVLGGLLARHRSQNPQSEEN
jgi:hypothetical protein